METKTVKELQAIAKQQKLRGYSRLRKAELITLLTRRFTSTSNSRFIVLGNVIFKLIYKNEPKIRESKTAIKGFAKQYVADGIAGTDAETFLNSAKSEVVNLIGKNRQTKINLVLFCKMERVDIKSGEVTNTVAPFVSKTEVVLEGTDVGELYNEASD